MGCGASSAAETNPMQRPSAELLLAPVTARPLTLCGPYRHGAPITQVQIDRQRQEFWATRVDGNAVIWQTLRSTAEALLVHDLPLANAILEAGNIITPTGSLELCYDERGFQYKVPTFCVSNPVDLLSDNESAPSPGRAGLSLAHALKQAHSARTITEATPVNLRVRINPGDINMMIAATTADSIYELKRLIYNQSVEAGKEKDLPVCEEKRQRVMLMGKELQDLQQLGDLRLEEGRVFQVFLRPQPSQ